ncbi:uncharacterized protein LOC130914400 [Corythoichthys intestinalis]|uniref:uncharacterized protein LOC130914400 n=1 Tax=Corythoichthys intestinalis TaxID=161448 RepID=UPI0025A58232|nr:uncharacterized protein LOC130914400 [Corythoichthys intestinalis]
MVNKKLKEAAMGFVLGAIGGCIMGAIEDPVDRTLSDMSTKSQLKPLIDDIRTVGALGLGTLMGASALTIAMTSVVAGVIVAAAVASVFVSTGSCGPTLTNYANLWTSAGLAGAFATTLSGATLGFFTETIVNIYGMVGLLCALSFFSILKPPLRFVFNVLWKQGEACCAQSTTAWETEREQLEISDLDQRERVAVQIEERILTIKNGRNITDAKDMSTWATERKLREGLERKKMEAEEAQIKQRTLQDWITTVMVKYVDFLAFSGIPMTVVAVVTSLFGLFGYAGHHFVFIALVALVAIIGYLIVKLLDFKFWMLIGCMGMLATFLIAMLTIQAGENIKAIMNQKGQPKHDSISIGDRMSDHSSREALKTAIIAAKLCQLSLGATVGGPLVRHAAGGGKVIIGAAIVAVGLLTGVEILSPVLGKGGKAGALLGVVGTSGVAMGAVAAMAAQCSSWPRTAGTVAGVIIGTLVMGELHIFMIGVQIIVAYIFAMTNAF